MYKLCLTILMLLYQIDVYTQNYDYKLTSKYSYSFGMGTAFPIGELVSSGSNSPGFNTFHEFDRKSNNNKLYMNLIIGVFAFHINHNNYSLWLRDKFDIDKKFTTVKYKGNKIESFSNIYFLAGIHYDSLLTIKRVSFFANFSGGFTVNIDDPYANLYYNNNSYFFVSKKQNFLIALVSFGIAYKLTEHISTIFNLNYFFSHQKQNISCDYYSSNIVIENLNYIKVQNIQIISTNLGVKYNF